MNTKYKPMKQERDLKLKEGEFMLTQGVWDENTRWKFIVSKEKLDTSLCTAVFCVTTYQSKLILVNHDNRGWEIPGGNIDDGEEIEDALVRELLEETGAVVENPELFGYKLVLPSSPIPRPNRPGKSYPFPRSYMPYYYAEASEVLNVRLAPDVIDTRLVGFVEAKKMLYKESGHAKIIEYLVKSRLISVNE